MIIDQLLPDYDVCDRYSVLIDAPVGKVWDTVWTFNICESPVVSWLFWLRGLPSDHVSFSELERLKFKLIGEERHREVVFGVIGQFWSIDGGLQDFDPAGFSGFSEDGFAKCAWSFNLETERESTRLTTETRVQCIGDSTRNYFDLYWTFVRPFSGWTRKEMLRTVKQKCETEIENS